MMKNLICKNCGNAEFKVLAVGETLCKCGRRLTMLSDYRWGNTTKWTELQKRRAEIISKISLLKREIDKCLDERDEEGFMKRTLELNLCEHFLGRELQVSEHQLMEAIKENLRH